MNDLFGALSTNGQKNQVQGEFTGTVRHRRKTLHYHQPGSVKHGRAEIKGMWMEEQLRKRGKNFGGKAKYVTVQSNE